MLITVLSEEGGSSELLQKLRERLIIITEELPELNLTFSAVMRFGEFLLFHSHSAIIIKGPISSFIIHDENYHCSSCHM